MFSFMILPDSLGVSDFYALHYEVCHCHKILLTTRSSEHACIRICDRSSTAPIVPAEPVARRSWRSPAGKLATFALYLPHDIAAGLTVHRFPVPACSNREGLPCWTF